MRRTRVRFAPSPTGPLHMGGVRTALYNYLFAKQREGDFILRIEDTDSKRFVEGSEEYIIEALKWCGIEPTEGVENGEVVSAPSERHPHAPYRQSQRKELYKRYAFQLIESGDAYYAFDTAEELDKLRKESQSRGEVFTYNYQVRDKLNSSLKHSKEKVEELLKSCDNWVIRFKTPVDREIEMEDQIRGRIVVNSSTLDDKVIWKASDGLPTYHLANIVDDKSMEISDVIRGEEWLPSLPLHYLLYEALGWNQYRPTFSHLSLLLKPDGKGKLSKRDGDRLGFPVYPLEWHAPDGEVAMGYREEGYLPEAFINMLALLGWNPGGEEELFSLEELVKIFSLDRVVRSGARFTLEKAKWFNQEYIRREPIENLVEQFKPILNSKGVEAEESFIAKALELIRERITFIDEAWELSNYLFIAPTEYDQKVKKRFWKEDSADLLANIVEMFSNSQEWSEESIERELKEYITTKELPMGRVMNSVRLLLVGESKGPSVAAIMELIGREESLKRLKQIP